MSVPTASLGQYTQLGVRRWRLDNAPVMLSKGWKLVPTPGWIQDGASVPRIAYPICDPTDLGLDATSIHDEGYGRGGWLTIGAADGAREWHQFTRRQIDAFLFDLAAHAGCEWWRRGLAFDAVRAFGWRKQHWNYTAQAPSPLRIFP